MSLGTTHADQMVSVHVILQTPNNEEHIVFEKSERVKCLFIVIAFDRSYLWFVVDRELKRRRSTLV